MNKVLIVDDHPVIRLAVRMLMERHGAGVDVPGTWTFFHALHAGGGCGYVCKQQDLTELLSAIKAVLSGYSYFPNQALNSVRSTMGNASEADMVERLSGREMMVLQQLARGRTNKEIADGMFLSNKTVSTYKTRLLLKLNAQEDIVQRIARVTAEKSLREGGFRLSIARSEIEVVIGQLFLQASFFQQIIDSTAFAQIGLGDLCLRCLCYIVVRLNEVVFHFQLLFASAHKVHSGLRLPLALLITIIHDPVKKIFSID
ncbi:bacterial regulatory protein, luxR family domain-containing protein [Ditylenchus destructor]|nr:bacterial regulatory protein, luxR family domain-containing protein [Ditylenchus destructor]